MRAKHVLKLADLYYDDLVGQGGITPKKADENFIVNKSSLGEVTAEAHLAWACTYIKLLVSKNELDLAEQWLGFVQGAMWMLGRFSIEEMRQHDIEPGYDPAGGGGGTGRSDFPAGMRGDD